MIVTTTNVLFSFVYRIWWVGIDGIGASFLEKASALYWRRHALSALFSGERTALVLGYLLGYLLLSFFLFFGRQLASGSEKRRENTSGSSWSFFFSSHI